MADSPLRAGEVVSLSGAVLAPVDGVAIPALTLMACSADTCAAIPLQVDERNADGRWVLDVSDRPLRDDPPQTLDLNDEMLFLATDAGLRVSRTQLPSAAQAFECRVTDPLTHQHRWVYLLVDAETPPSTQTYVRYDPQQDRVHTGEVTMGFTDGVPTYLGVPTAEPGGAARVNVLDRIKIRAEAKFLWGMVRFRRNEGDLIVEQPGWRHGPIRIIRRQRQRVHVGWGIRSPTFEATMYFYPDVARLPVGLRLNFPPTRFFTDIEVQIIMDFRDLRGWHLMLPRAGWQVPITAEPASAAVSLLNDLPAQWLALRGPRVTFVQTFGVSASLTSVRQRLLYREGESDETPPEAVPGERPAVGYRLDQWNDVAAGAHWLEAVNYTIPSGVDVAQFIATREAPLQALLTEMPPLTSRSVDAGHAAR